MNTIVRFPSQTPNDDKRFFRKHRNLSHRIRPATEEEIKHLSRGVQLPPGIRWRIFAKQFGDLILRFFVPLPDGIRTTDLSDDQFAWLLKTSLEHMKPLLAGGDDR